MLLINQTAVKKKTSAIGHAGKKNILFDRPVENGVNLDFKIYKISPFYVGGVQNKCALFCMALSSGLQQEVVHYVMRIIVNSFQDQKLQLMHDSK